jgi:pimeloyl-ACP methyl ester carboxylesterase
LNIAYQAVGDGPFDLVFVPGTITHVELDWENPHWASFVERLTSFSRLILFDRRGIGLSDRISGVPTLEERIDDLRVVLDAVGSERAALFGSGDAGAMFALFARTGHWSSSYPTSVDAGTDYPWGMDVDEAGDGLRNRCSASPTRAT